MARKPAGYWENFENVKKELNPIISEYGLIPSYPILNKCNSSLPKAITQYHGGIQVRGQNLL